MSKKNIMFQSSSLKPNNNTIIWNNNNINGNININNNYSTENLNSMINPIKRSGSLNFKNSTNTIVTPNYSNHFKQIKLGNISNINNNNTNKIKTKIKGKKNYMENTYSTKTEGNNNNELEMAHAKNYINYLYEHLDTSYNANSEISNKTEMIINMKKDIESEIKRNNDVYKSLILSYNDKLKMNNKYKNDFINFLNLYKKQYKSFNTEIKNKKEKLDDLVLKNKELKREVKNTEDIINYLKQTQDILINNNFLEKKGEKNNNNQEDEIDILKKELTKLKEIIDSGNKMKIKNIKNNEKIEEVNKYSNKINSSNMIGANNKIRNKKFILDGNKFKKNLPEYNKQQIEKGSINKSKTSKEQKSPTLDIEKDKEEKENDNIKPQIKELILESESNKKSNNKIIEEKNENEITEEKPIKKEEKKIKEEIEEKKEKELDEEIIEEKVIVKKDKKKKTKKKSKTKEKNKEYEIIIPKPKKKKKKSKQEEINNISLEKEEEKETKETKEYKISDISDNNSKKSDKNISDNLEENPDKKEEKISPQLSQNSLSLDVSSIKSSSKTQKKLSQSQESIIDILTTPLKGAYLYTITPKGKLLSFNISQKKFAIIDSSIIDGWTSFIPNYLKNIEGSLLLNTLEGLFIITGNNFSDLYFYSQEKCLIAKITTFKYGHKYGGLLLSPSPDNNLFVIGGECPNNEVELLSFEDDQNKEIPNLLSKRINASYTFINYKLYAIFGQDNDTIEYLNIKKLKNKWNKIDYKMNEGKINNLYGHVSLPVQDNNILIIGGKNNKKLMVLDLDEKTLDITDMKIPFIDTIEEYIFDKEKFFNQTVNEENKNKEGKNVKQLIGMDSYGNIHLFDYNFNYVVLLIKNHNNNNGENNII